MPAQSENKKYNFSLARPSRARNYYTCTLCSNTISQGQYYYRLDPHPMSRYYRGELPTYICLKCARAVGADLSLLESKYAPRLSNQRLPSSHLDTRYEQLAMRLEEPIQVVPAKVHLVNITAQLRFFGTSRGKRMFSSLVIPRQKAMRREYFMSDLAGTCEERFQRFLMQ